MIQFGTELPSDPAPPTHREADRFLPLLRGMGRWFEEEEFARLIPGIRSTPSEDFAPLTETERIAFSFLTRGGKRFRPFVTLAAYHAMAEEPEAIFDIPDEVKRACIAVEAFHKASLVHDDIEDDDLFRYGRETLHRQYDTATAINVGDYLVGFGYRLITDDRRVLGSECAADILHHLMDAHVRLSEGQGAELAWRRSVDKYLRPNDALRIYQLKTSPAFEAALYAGVRLAGDADTYARTLTAFSRHLGIAFQILNDLKDWRGDEDNKLVAGQDAWALRPTLLLALALENDEPAIVEEFNRLLTKRSGCDAEPHRLRELFEGMHVFQRAAALVEKSRGRAQEIADGAGHAGLRFLLHYLVDAVLARSTAQKPVGR